MSKKLFSGDNKFYTGSGKFEALPFLRNLNKKSESCKNKFCKIVFCKEDKVNFQSIYLEIYSELSSLENIFKMKICVVLSKYLPFWVREGWI